MIFLHTPGSVRASVELNKLGGRGARLFAAGYVGEDNADVIFTWSGSAPLSESCWFFLLFSETAAADYPLGRR